MQQLVVFVSVAAAASFSATARELDLNPESVRHAIGELERLVGLRLFERSPQRISLTPPGRLVLALAQRVVYLATVIGSVSLHGEG